MTLFFTNQFRQKIGLVFGDPRTTPGGNALKFYASVRLEISRKERVKIDGIDMGNTTKVKVVKNKVAPPFQECEFDILWGQGIDVGSEVLAMALARNIVTKSGSYINFPNGTRVQGFTAAAQAVTDEPGQLALLLAAIKTTPSALPKVKGDE